MCGSIAAYKSAVLVRLLVKAGADVRVVMTPGAKAFITPLTLSTLSKNPVVSDFVKNDTGEWNNHVELGLWADALIIAPASANTIAKLANGLCDNLLCATYLSARCPVYLAPAMDLDMYAHQATKINLDKLRSYGNEIVEVRYGELASGLTGDGRMAEPEELIEFLSQKFSASKKKLPLKDRAILVTAGPTYEAIDPVRFIGNHSSGKMGFSIAEELAKQGAHVHLITGPTSLSAIHPAIHLTHVTSAEEMYHAAVSVFKKCDAAVMSAAVADYTPVQKANEKIKKKTDTFTIELKKTKDIAAELGRVKTNNQLLVTFALETENELHYAKEKLAKKNADFIVLNSLRTEGAGFGVDTNKITIIDRHNKVEEFELKSKADVARDIVKKMTALIINRAS